MHVITLVGMTATAATDSVTIGHTRTRRRWHGEARRPARRGEYCSRGSSGHRVGQPHRTRCGSSRTDGRTIANAAGAVTMICGAAAAAASQLGLAFDIAQAAYALVGDTTHGHVTRAYTAASCRPGHRKVMQ